MKKIEIGSSLILRYNILDPLPFIFLVTDITKTNDGKDYKVTMARIDIDNENRFAYRYLSYLNSTAASLIWFNFHEL